MGININNQKTQLIGIGLIILFLFINLTQRIDNLQDGTAKADSGIKKAAVIDNTGDTENAVGDRDGGQPSAPVLEIQENDHVKGNADADVVVFEFSDAECPFCARVHPTLDQLVKDYDGDVAWVYNHFPLSSHANAREKAIAAECVALSAGNDGFWTFMDAIFERGTSFPVSGLADLAVEAGADKSDFETCLANEDTAEIVDADQALGTQSGVSGTPGNIIVNVKTGESRLVPGALPLEQFKQVIDGML